MADVPGNWTWAAGPVDAGSAVVFDLDGVLADGWHRQHHLDGLRRDWESFFRAAGQDGPIESTIRLARLIDATTVIVILTARPAWIHQDTVRWLAEHDVRWDLLVMRGRRDGGHSSREFKRRTVAELRAHGFEVEVALDDDLRIVEMYGEEDVPVVYIHSGYYDRP